VGFHPFVGCSICAFGGYNRGSYCEWHSIPTLLGAVSFFPRHISPRSCVGSGHMLLGTRADWRQHMLRVRDELGFTGVRGHGILDDDMSVIIDGAYHFYNVDQVPFLFVFSPQGLRLPPFDWGPTPRGAVIHAPCPCKVLPRAVPVRIRQSTWQLQGACHAPRRLQRLVSPCQGLCGAPCGALRARGGVAVELRSLERLPSPFLSRQSSGAWTIRATTCRCTTPVRSR
jgi:hypothetical protein